MFYYVQQLYFNRCKEFTYWTKFWKKKKWHNQPSEKFYKILFWKILTSYHVSFSDCGAYSKGIKKTRIMHDIKEMIHNRLPVASTTINTGIEHILSRSFC